MLKIRFNHRYPKLRRQTSAVLLEVLAMNRSKLDGNFIRYDTAYKENGEWKNYEIPNTMIILLVFRGNFHVPFTTTRKYEVEKEFHYIDKIGKTFEIVIEEKS